MTFYPSDDWTAISAIQGRCEGHERPLDARTGRHVRRWAVDCPAHEPFYKGADKPKILKYIKDKKTGAILRQDRVPDQHPGIGFTPGTVPLTRDEEEDRALALERGENQLRAIDSVVQAKAAGIDLTNRPDVLLFLQENHLPEDILQGSVLCLNDHANPAGVKFCHECGLSMTARAAIGARKDAPETRPARKPRATRNSAVA
jgi:hypothetical protein